MPLYCTVCMNNTRKCPNLSYFSFPNDSTRRSEWLKAVGREDLIPKLNDVKKRQQYRICEDHFEKTCIKYSKKRTVKYLFKNVFPTLNLPLNEGASSSQKGTYPQNIQIVQSIPVIELISSPNSPSGVLAHSSIQTDVDVKKPSESVSTQTPLNISGGSPMMIEVELDLQEDERGRDCDLNEIITDESTAPVFVDITTNPQQTYKEEVESDEEEEPDEPDDTMADIPPDDPSPDDTPLDTTSEQETKDDTQSNPFLTVQSRRIRCKECFRFTAETEEKMMRHVRKMHRGENPFQCSLCDYSTYNKAVFEEHVRIHQGIKPFKCSHCPYRSASKKNTKKHELIHRPNNPNRCNECGFIARHERGLLSHRKTHAPETAGVLLPECIDCKKMFSDFHTLQNHRLYECKIKSRVYGTEKKRRPPKKIKKGFVCAICKWVGNFSKPRILLHLIHHPNQDVDKNLVDVEVLRRCGIMVGG